MIRRQVKPIIAKGSGDVDTLVVAFHGCTWTSWRRRHQLHDVIDALREWCPTADIFTPLLPIEFWSLQNPDRIVREVIAHVDSMWDSQVRSGQAYRKVILIGFSFGSVLIRQLFCRAAGALEDATIDKNSARPWARKVERIVLLAGLNRGWTADSPVTRVASFGNHIGTAIGHLLPWKPTLFAIRRGAPFLTRTRLQWLALRGASLRPPTTVQLLGTRDDIVSPADNIDVATGADFIYLEVPRSGHFDVVHMKRETVEGDIRRRCLQLAVVGSQAELQREAIPLQDVLQLVPTDTYAVGDLGPQSRDSLAVSDVVFVVHGIRDKGYWTRKIARVVVVKGRRSGRRVAALAPSYGYFAMLPFLWPWTRRSKVEWLLDMYVTVRCWHPKAAISFIGHSNGTYILAGAVKACPAVQFNNVVFAGSVVRSDFEWNRYIGHDSARKPSQVSRVLNYVATSDWVVAIFPRLLQTLRQDVGGAGFDGFLTHAGDVHDVKYVPGRHSAALDERYWDDMATFALDGKATPSPTVGRPHPLNVAAAHAAPFLWLLAIVIAAGPIYLLLSALGEPNRYWLLAAMLVVWLRIVTAILTLL